MAGDCGSVGLELKEKPVLVAETLGPWGMVGVRVRKAGGKTTEGPGVMRAGQTV